MKRAFTVLAAASLMALMAAGPAQASQGQVTHSRFHGAFAEALWGVSSPSTQVQADVTVSLSSMLVVLSTAHFDRAGNFTGATVVSSEVFQGYSFSIDTVKLATASASAEGLPAQSCDYDANGNLVGCTDTSIGLDVSWTGQGLIGTETTNTRFKSCDISYGYHGHGTDRDAVAAGTVDGVAFGQTDVMFAHLGTTKAGETYFRINKHC